MSFNLARGMQSQTALVLCFFYLEAGSTVSDLTKGKMDDSDISCKMYMSSFPACKDCWKCVLDVFILVSVQI